MSVTTTALGAVDEPADTVSPEVDTDYSRAQRRRVRRRRLLVLGLQAAFLIGFLMLWEWAADRQIPALFISRPSDFLPKFWDWLVDGTLLRNTVTTFRSAGIGLLTGALAGIVVGVILAQFDILGRVFEPFITALYTMPRIALIPVFIMWVGIGWELSALTAAIMVFFTVFFNTFFGMREVRRPLIDAVLTMGGTQVDVLRSVRLPSALIWVVAAMKLAAPQALVGVVVVEMVAGNKGLGYLVSRNARTFQSAGTFAALLALLLVGFAIDRLMTWLTKKPLQWKDA